MAPYHIDMTEDMKLELQQLQRDVVTSREEYLNSKAKLAGALIALKSAGVHRDELAKATGMKQREVDYILYTYYDLLGARKTGSFGYY